MALRLFNTLTGQKEAFEPLEPGKVRMYVCGPTVYDMAHAGHARCYVAFDTIVRYLRRRYDVWYVRNFTDVDDKIIKRANELGEDSRVVSERFINEFHTDMDALGVLRADVQPKVTEHIPEIITLVEQLIAQRHAYALEGDVYYAVESFRGYGKLAHRSLEDMEAGARVEVDTRKRNPLDFALWKTAKPGEPAWNSPWGKGRPGWHIECSAMSSKYLGQTFDIHGGGKDLAFPHHENEIAQSESATGETFARYWMHNGFVNIDNEKMSKSLSNFFTVRDLLARFDAQTLRYYLLTTHYRSPISFSTQALEETETRVRYLYETLARLAGTEPGPTHAPFREPWVGEVLARFDTAMDDDFNTARAVGDLSEVFRLINDIKDRPGDAEVDARTLRALAGHLQTIGAVLGLFAEPATQVLARIDGRRKATRNIDPAAVERLLDERIAARKARDFARADAVRDQLKAMGVAIKDTPQGTVWEVQ